MPLNGGAGRGGLKILDVDILLRGPCAKRVPPGLDGLGVLPCVQGGVRFFEELFTLIKRGEGDLRIGGGSGVGHDGKVGWLVLS